MSINSQDTLPKFFIIPALVVVSVWIWASVRTKGALRVISRGVIPYSRRAVWLLKILALIVGGGGVVSLAQELGAPWFLAIALVGVILFFSLKEKVADVVPPRPLQDACTYQMAWREYDRLREAYMRSLRWFAVALVTLILVLILSWSERLPQRFLIGLFGVCFIFGLPQVSSWA